MTGVRMGGWNEHGLVGGTLAFGGVIMFTFGGVRCRDCSDSVISSERACAARISRPMCFS